jgi:hypothetical protein
VIEHERRSRRIRKLRHAELAQLLERVARACVVQHREIDSRDRDFTSANGMAGVRAQDFFGERKAQRWLQTKMGQGEEVNAILARPHRRYDRRCPRRAGWL